MTRTTALTRSDRPAMLPAQSPPVTDALIDLENLFPGGWWTHDTHELLATTTAAIELAPIGARILVACCGDLAARVLDALLLPQVDVRAVAPTADAADRCLEAHMAALPPDRHVLLVTGDGGLAEVTDARVRAGIPVTVVSQPSHLSRRLRAVATDCRPFRAPVRRANPRRTTSSRATTTNSTNNDLRDAA